MLKESNGTGANKATYNFATRLAPTTNQPVKAKCDVRSSVESH